MASITDHLAGGLYVADETESGRRAHRAVRLAHADVVAVGNPARVRRGI